MRNTCLCKYCSAPLEFDSANAGHCIVCPQCSGLTLPNAAVAAASPRATGGGYLTRWRGRTEGPLTVGEIEQRLRSGQLSMLTEVQYESRWISMREFLPLIAPSQPPPPSASPAEPAPSLPMAAPAANPPPVKQNKFLVFAGAGIAAILLLAGAAAWLHLRAASRATPAPPVAARHSPPPQPEPPPTPTNHAAAAPPAPPIITNVVSSIRVPMPTNKPTAEYTPPANPLPADQPRTFRFKGRPPIEGTIAHVNPDGVVLRDTSENLTSRIPWADFEPDALEREPKVIEYRTKAEAKRYDAAVAKYEAECAAAQAKQDELDKQARLAAYHASQDALIDKSIATGGYSVVTKGCLKAWGDTATIGEIFAVVAPSAVWTAAKLADHEPERYTHYLVEAVWVNTNGEHVKMQYLVTADGSDFYLHGCFVDGTKMDDLPFLLTVKKIWNERK